MTGWLSAGKRRRTWNDHWRLWAQQLHGWWYYLPRDRTLEGEAREAEQELHSAESSKRPSEVVRVNNWMVWCWRVIWASSTCRR